MSSSKRKSKDDQIPKPISIKKEKSEEDRTLQPISHYIDDRLELVKQIFGTLKPKTIMNLAPEFLKKTNLDEIEELCLNELLCISTKRLKSIIADTPCPSDTESSEDSDVERKEEHISLEEISSDSDIGGNETRRAKKLRKSNAKRADKTNENKEPEGQISVLELLELQARARAIRSQLAMEPITKIEVKSDDEEEEEENKQRAREKNKDKNKDRRSRKTSDLSSRHKTSDPSRSSASGREPAHAQTNGSNSKETPAPATKRIKLKRNYRNSTKSPEKEVEPVASQSKPDITQEPNKSRSASPDVIPIPAEPETLLISDSTDDEDTQSKPKESQVAVPLPTVEPAPEPVEESEPEEGEVRDEPRTESPVVAKEQQPSEHSAEAIAETDTPSDSLPAESIPAEETTKECEKPAVAEPEPMQLSNPVVDDEDQNDDVISIGGDLEMIEELSKVEDEPAAQVKVEQKMAEPDEEDNDVISLNTSEDERDKLQETNSESWRTRYLKSSKVNQVLAASRLGKRVRDKIKESKRAQKKHNEGKAAAASNEKTSSQQQQFSSKHEDGSMEQYKELLQHRQRKSSNSSKGDK